MLFNTLNAKGVSKIYGNANSLNFWYVKVLYSESVFNILCIETKHNC